MDRRERGRALHDRATRGLPLSADEQAELDAWYEEEDRLEGAVLDRRGADVPPEGIEVRPGIYHHPRSPDASPERLRQILGSIKLTGPVPRVDFFDDEDEEEQSHCAG